MSPLIMYMTSSLGSTWSSPRPPRPRATKAIESSVCHSTLIGRVAPAISFVIWPRSIARIAVRSMTASRSLDREQPPRVPHQGAVDLALRDPAPAHQRHHVGEDVAVAVTAPADQPRAVADVVGDEDLAEVPPLDEPAHRAQADRVVGHVDVGQPVERRLLAEQIPLEHAAGVGQPTPPVRVAARAGDGAEGP